MIWYDIQLTEYYFLDSYTEKMEAQKSLLQDETWVNNYRKKILKMLVKQVQPSLSEIILRDI